MRISKNKVLIFFVYLYRLSQIEHDIPDPLNDGSKIFVMLRVTEEKERNFEKRDIWERKYWELW